MPWPSRRDYAQAVDFFPHISILDPELRGGTSRRGANNSLIPHSGGFSIVFPIEGLSNTYALRCWIADIGDAETRYREIGNYLRQCRLPYFVDFEYVPNGIMINGDKYPVTRMEWAEGETLCNFIKQNLQDAGCLKTAAVEFQKMVAVLHAHQISHGDLQDGNILFKRSGTDVEIKLIDYDSLFVPALRGQPDNIVGLPEYQHPQRMAGGGKANEKVDYFSELVIYLSLLSLAENPDLWSQFGVQIEREFLFTAEDFKNPDQSDVFRELENLSLDVKQLAAKLKEFCKLSLDQLKPLEAVLPKTSPAQVAHDQGLAYLHSNQYDEAIVEFEKAIGLDPNYKEAYHGLSLAYFQMSNFGAAKKAAEAALRIDPYYQPAIQLLDAIRLSTTPPVTPVPPTGQSGSTGTTSASHSTPPAGTSGLGATNPTPQPSPPTGAPGPAPTNVASQGSASTGQSGSTGTKPASQVPKSQRASLNHWQLLTGALASVLVIWIVVFAMLMRDKNGVPPDTQQLQNQLAELRNERILLGDKNQKLNTEIVSLKDSNQKLRIENQKLHSENVENRLQRRRQQPQPAGGTQLNPQTGANSNAKQIPIIQQQTSEADLAAPSQELQNQLTAERTNEEIQAQITKAQNEMVALRSQNEKLQDENEKLRSETRMLNNDNRALRDANQRLDNENVALQKELKERKEDTGKPPPIDDHHPPAPLLEISLDRHPRIRPAALSKNNQGYIAFNRSEYDRAIALFQDGIMHDSRAAVVHYNLGCTYIKKEEYTKARSYLREAVTLDPNFKEAHYNLALVYLGLRYLPEAERAVQAALNIDENYPLARELLEAIE